MALHASSLLGAQLPRLCWPIAGSPDNQGSYLHYAPRTEEERREQRKAARLALVRNRSQPFACHRPAFSNPRRNPAPDLSWGHLRADLALCAVGWVSRDP